MRRALVILTLAAVAGCAAPADDVDPSQTCEQIGHEYAAEAGDPHDADGDGRACEEGSR
jgi:hypothetical protein